MDLTANIKDKDVTNELDFSASRSSGPGGQNVNKVNTKVTLRFDVRQSQMLTDDEKELIIEKLSPKLTTEGVLVISAQEERSQLKNKEAAIVKFNQLMQKAFAKKKARKATKPSKSAIKKRLEKKKMHAEKKKMRQKI